MGDVGGAVTTEYVVVVATMGFALMFALVALGPKMVQGYQQNRASIASPFP